MQLDQNLLKVPGKVSVIPRQSDTSRSRAQKYTSTARSESHQSFPAAGSISIKHYIWVAWTQVLPSVTYR